MSFKSLYLEGKVTIDQLDDFIEEWHSKPETQTLPEFLGLTLAEFKIFMRGYSELQKVLDIEKRKTVATYSDKIRDYYGNN